jgi:hypothetical protein
MIMKTIGICGFVVLVAAVAALIGPGSASAVTLCSEAGGGEECPPGKIYVEREYKSETEGEAKLLSYRGGVFQAEVKCKPARIIFKTTAEKANPIPGVIGNGNFTLGTCEPCKKNQVLNLSYNLAITSTGLGTANGNMEITSGGSGAPTILLEECNATCKYIAVGGKVNLTFTGGTPGKLVANGAPFQYSSGSGEFFCGDEIRLEATYKITEPGTVYVKEKP